jgi:Domain of unknown function (DUF6438)/Sigma-70, region 4
MHGQASEAKIMKPVVRRLTDSAVLSRLSSWRARPWGDPWLGREDIVAAADSITGVGLSRSPCYGECPAYTVTLHRNGRADFNGEVFVDLLGPHSAELLPGSFDDLARAIMFLCPPLPESNDDPKTMQQRIELSQDSLTGRQRLVLLLRLGLEDGRVHTVEEVARMLSMSPDGIRAIEATAHRKVRQASSRFDAPLDAPAAPYDAPTTTTWIMRGDKESVLDCDEFDLASELIDAAASELAWRPLAGEPADHSIAETSVPPDDQTHWTQRIHG